MAIALDQQAVNNSTATTVVVTIPATAAGALLVACISFATASSQTITGVTDSAGNTWTGLTARFQSGTNSYVQVWYAKNAASVTSVTATGSSTAAKGMNVTSWTGMRTDAAVFEAENGTNGAASTTITAATQSTVAASTLVVKCANHNGSASAGTLSWTGATALTKPTGTSTGQSLEAAYKVYSTTGQSEATTWTITSGAWGTETVVFVGGAADITVNAPAATVTVAASTPTVDKTVDAPAATMSTSAPAPDVGAIVNPDPATITVAAQTPTVDKTVDVPVATGTGLAPVPTVNKTLDAPAPAAAASAPTPTLFFQAGTVWPAEGRFIFYLCDSDGDFIAEIREAKARRLTYQLNGIHTADITLSLDDDLAADIEPGLSRLKVYRLQTDGTRVLCFYGTVPAHTVREDAAASEMSMTFMDPRWVLQYRYIHANNNLLYLQPGEPIVSELSGVFTAFIGDATSFYGMSGGSVWITWSGSFPTTTSGTWPVDARPIYDQLTDFTAVDGGVDWDVDPVDYFTSSGTRFQGNLKIYQTQGSDQTNTQFIYGEDLPSNVAGMTRTYTAPITYATVTGTDTDTSETLTSSAGTPDDATYGALEVVQSAPDVRDQGQLDATAAGIVAANAFPRQVIAVAEPLANAPVAFDDYYIGDTVYVTCRKGSMIFNHQAQRVHAFTIDIGDTGYEAISLTLAD